MKRTENRCKDVRTVGARGTPLAVRIAEAAKRGETFTIGVICTTGEPTLEQVARQVRRLCPEHAPADLSKEGLSRARKAMVGEMADARGFLCAVFEVYSSARGEDAGPSPEGEVQVPGAFPRGDRHADYDPPADCCLHGRLRWLPRDEWFGMRGVQSARFLRPAMGQGSP